MARTRKCKYCGTEMPKSAKRCPNCNKKVKHPIVALLCTVIILITVFLIVSILSDTSTTGNTSGTNSPTSPSSQTGDSAEKPSSVIIADNDYITAEFVEYDNQPSLGVFYTILRVTNKTDQKIWVYLDEASVNDEMIQVLSGTPLYILPEKKGTNAFIFSFSQISIDSFDEVNTVSFKIAVKNEETLADICTTGEITLTK